MTISNREIRRLRQRLATVEHHLARADRENAELHRVLDDVFQNAREEAEAAEARARTMQGLRQGAIVAVRIGREVTP